jgi:parallel beta-helix repeat protein
MMKKYIPLLLIPLLLLGGYLFAGPVVRSGGGIDDTTPTSVTLVVAANDTIAAKKAAADYVCDNTADEVQINAALTALPANGGRVILLEGTYTIVDPITFPKNNCVLEGQGRSTFIDGDGLANTEHAILVPARTGCTIKNLRIQTEDGGAKTCHGIYATGTCNNLEIDGVIITDSDSDGIHILPDNAYEIYIFNCIIDDADGYGIYVDPTPADYNYNMHIKDCLIIGTGSSGIYFGSTGAGSWYAEVDSNMIYSAGGQGIQATEIVHSSFSNNISTANTSDGMILNGNHTNIKGGQYYANGANGIELATALECSIEGTFCNDNTGSGIELDGGSDLALIANNHCCGNTLDGIRVGGTRDNIVSNICQDNDLHGINLGNPDCRVSGNLIYDNSQGGAGTSHGINIGNDADRTLVSGNHINDPGDSTEDGIYLTDGAINCNIIGNIAYNLMGDGIKLAGNNTGTVIEGNTCHTLDENGIVVSDSLDCKISNNYCVGNTHHGIYLDNADRALVTGNTCKDNDALNASTYDGIYVDADSASCLVSSNYFYGNDRAAITDSGTLTQITSNEGADETVTAAAPTLQHWGYSAIDSNARAVDAVLPDGKYIGQIKTIVMTEASNSSTVTVTHHDNIAGIPATGGAPTGDGEIGTFDAVDEAWMLIWTGTEWTTLRASCTF